MEIVRPATPPTPVQTSASLVPVQPVHLLLSRTPPPFLCPFIDSSDLLVHCLRPETSLYQRPSSSDSHPQLSVPSSSNQKKRLSRRANIPDRYQQGEDGGWDRVEEYTLYGSTVCLGCQPEPTSADNVRPPALNPVMPDILDQLPQGWKPATTSRGARTALILAMSLALAFFICFFMTSCIIWRRNRSRMKKKKDEEMSASRPPTEDEMPMDPDVQAERDERHSRHLWARATARWKANARFLARQRRGIRRAFRQPSLHNPSTVLSDLNQNEPAASTSFIPRPSTSASPASSTHDLSPPQSIPTPTLNGQTVPPPADTLHAPPPLALSPSPPPLSLTPPHLAPISPPAYHAGDNPPPPSMLKSPDTDNTLGSQTLTPTYAHPLADSITSDDAAPPPHPVFYSAHVATDDKALIAQMANMASAPPTDNTSQYTNNLQASVPVWQDEEIEDFSCASCSNAEGSRPSPFPPPPAQFKYGASSFSDYDVPYDVDMDSMEPSAPPFVEDGSPPGLIPSAPPLQECEPREGEDASIEGQEHQRRAAELSAQNHDREGDELTLINSRPSPDVLETTNDERPPRYGT